MNILRRLSLSRLLLLCGVVVAVGIGASALALALNAGPTPPPKPLAQAVHDALAAPRVSGVSATIQLEDHLLDSAALEAAGTTPSSGNPLLNGASGRLWIAADGRVRIELQSNGGDTQILYDPSSRTISLYDASAGTLYRYEIPAGSEGPSGSSASSEGPSGTSASSEGSSGSSVSSQESSGSSSTSSEGSSSSRTASHEIPTVAAIQEAIEQIMRHANLSGATPTDVAGQAAYSVRISPSHDGGLVGGAELAWDAVHGVPLRLAIYSTESSSPVLALTATEVSYGPVEESVFDISPPPGTKVTEVTQPTDSSGGQGAHPQSSSSPPVSGVAAVQAALPFSLDAPGTLASMRNDRVDLVHVDGKPAALLTYGEGLGGIAVLESQADASATHSEASPGSLAGELPQLSIGGATATELPTALGTLLSFERSGVRYVVVGSVTPTVAQEAAKGL